MLIEGYYLDKYQMDAIKYNGNLLIVAGAGCGKTSTILGKVKYLVDIKGVNQNDILCISLTNETTNNLSIKLSNMGYGVDVKTFHKFGLDLLKKEDQNIKVCNFNLLDYIVDEYFKSVVRFSNRKYLLFIVFFERFNNIMSSNIFYYYKKNVVTFINLVKNKGLGINYIYELYKKSILDKITYYFILEIYVIYKRELESLKLVDFNDIIINSANLIKDKRIKLNYKYIIIDEFQDTSLIRLNLIINIINLNNAKLFCVGDDYQSIYRFNGCDLNIFLNFRNYIKNSKIMYLKNTYRNSLELIKVSSNFIVKNKFQMKKELLSNKRIDKPIVIIYTNDYKITFKNLCNKLKNYMVIGRNNIDIKKYSDDIVINNYYTVHASKGLESDNVILINLENSYMGFPSNVKNVRFVNKLFNNELYPYDEERRLFYVALTRTKNHVYIIVDKNKESSFIIEIKNDYKDYIELIDNK